MSARSHLKIGIWDFIISQPEKKCLAFLEKLALQGPRHMCYYKEFLVAEVDGKPVAALEGFDTVSNGVGGRRNNCQVDLLGDTAYPGVAIDT
jgi:hypothetical protein